MQSLHEVDVAAFDAIASAEIPVIGPMFRPLTEAANHGFLWFGIAGVMAALGGPRGRRAAARGSASLLLTSALVNGPMKLLARRKRPLYDRVPTSRLLTRQPTSFSFPSGHASSAAAFAMGASVELPRAASVPLALAAASVAFSRVYVGVHYPGDVLMGAAAGAGFAWATTKIGPWPIERAVAAAGEPV